jgi:cysteine desulfurase family protein (TIGR01976 family)
MLSENQDFPIDWLRSAFPSLDVEDAGRKRIYLDNPAGTQVPASVANAIRNTILFENANLGGSFPTSEAAGHVIEEGHRAIADFFGCSPEEVVIGPNMTSLTFHFSRMIARHWKEGDEIVVTQMDHEGNVSPWLQLAEDMGLVVHKVPFDTDSWQIEPEALESVLSARTRLVAITASSNLTGSINRLAELIPLIREAGALVYVDAVQFAPHGFVDVGVLDCDFLVCSSYKFFGPHLGILYARKSVMESLDPYKCRCSSNALPERFETGTPQIELVAGLTACVEHFAKLGEAVGEKGDRRARISAAFESSIRHEMHAAATLINGLRTIRGLTIHGITDSKRFTHRVPTVSFTLSDMAPVDLVRCLNEEGIFCWAGHNYAWEVVHQLGIDPAKGVVRIGIANYNTAEEIDRTLESVERNIAMLRQER